MSHRYLGQSPFDAVYALFVSDEVQRFQTDCFTKFLSADLVLGAFHLEAAIIGESHYIIVKDSDGAVLCVELLACVSFDGLPFARPEIVCPVTRATQLHDVETGCITVKMSLLVGSSVPSGVSLKHLDRSSFIAESRLGISTLEVPFEGPGAPRTRLTFVFDPNVPEYLQIRTVHEYVFEDSDHQVRITPILTTTNLEMRS